jgi:hypothetical protein
MQTAVLTRTPSITTTGKNTTLSKVQSLLAVFSQPFIPVVIENKTESFQKETVSIRSKSYDMHCVTIIHAPTTKFFSKVKTPCSFNQFNLLLVAIDSKINDTFKERLITFLTALFKQLDGPCVFTIDTEEDEWTVFGYDSSLRTEICISIFPI